MTKEEALQIIYDRCQHCDETDEAFKVLREDWIPISSGKLPEETKTKGHGLCHVLVTHKYAGIMRTHQAAFVEGKFLRLEHYTEDNTVTAWMPLPKPYEGSEVNE